MEYLWVIFTITCLYLLGVQILKRLRISSQINKIPGPKPYPLVGNMPMFLVPQHEILSTFLKVHREFGDIFRTWHGSRPVVHLVSPQLMEAVLGANNKHMRKGKAYQFILPWLGTGLLTSFGQKWFSHRKLISPTFHFKVLEGFLEVFNECSQVLVKKLSDHADGQFFDVCPYITRCALDIICETAMGTKINAQDNDQSPYVTATLKVSELIVQRQFKIWLHSDAVFNRTKQGREFQKSLEIIHGFAEKVIRDKKNARKPMREAAAAVSNDQDLGMKNRLAFLDLLIDSAEGQKVPLTDVEIREEVDTFMFEGHDTTTTSVSWTLLLLGNHPEIQAAVRKELDGIFQGDGRPVNLRDLGQMKLLERVIKESLRLYPSVTIITRLLDEDLKLDKYIVPAQTNVALHIYSMHRHPLLYPDPLKFDPDRFLPSNAQGRHPYAYLPFSAGQRNCIGQKFAIFEEKIVLSAILRKFKVKALKTADQVPSVHELVNRPLGGIQVQLTPV